MKISVNITGNDIENRGDIAPIMAFLGSKSEVIGGQIFIFDKSTPRLTLMVGDVRAEIA